MVPTEVDVGTLPEGNCNTSHCVAFPACQVTVGLTVDELTIKPVGVEQVKGAVLEQLTVASQPELFIELSDVNTKVKQPPGVEELIALGEVEPDKVANNGALAELPS